MNPFILSDSTLIQRIRKDQESAFRILFDTWYHRLFHFANEFVLDDESAGSIVQEAFLKLWEKKEELPQDSNITAWLFTVVKNDCLKLLRKRKKEVLSNFSAEDLSYQDQLSEQALEQMDTSSFAFIEMDRLIQEAYETLSPRCQEVFRMSRFEGRKNSEIADVLGISLKAVEAQISKALRIYREALKDYLPLLILLLL
jgi:RNA polymerase sigma-70 factor (ECF subfamily)